MSDDGGLITLLFFIVITIVVFLPTITAFWFGHRYRWIILIANFFMPAAPPAWLALLLGTMFTGRQHRR